MEYATPRQVHYAARILGKYARHNRLYQLPSRARAFVTTGVSTHSVSTKKLAMLSKEEMSSLLRELKG